MSYVKLNFENCSNIPKVYEIMDLNILKNIIEILDNKEKNILLNIVPEFKNSYSEIYIYNNRKVINKKFVKNILTLNEILKNNCNYEFIFIEDIKFIILIKNFYKNSKTCQIYSKKNKCNHKSKNTFFCITFFKNCFSSVKIHNTNQLNFEDIISPQIMEERIIDTEENTKIIN